MNARGERTLTDTPCRGICTTTNLGDNVCRGCGRTAEEVLKWNTYTPQQKIAINSRLRAEQANKLTE